MSGWRERVSRVVVLRAGWMLGAVGLAGLAVAYGTALRAPAAGVFHDDGIYAVTAKSLATGHGYHIVSLPTEIAETKYPFLFPVLLAGIWKLAPQFPENLLWLKLVPLAGGLAWGVLEYHMLREKTGSAPAARALAVLMALSPWLLFLSTTLLSETWFAAALTGALLLAGRLERRGGTWGTVVGLALVASAAFLTRTVGILVIGAGGLAVWRNGRIRHTLAFLLICAGLCLPWIWWQAHQDTAALAHEPYYSQCNYANWNILMRFAPYQKAHILMANLAGVWIAPALLMGVPATGWGTLLALLIGGVVAVGFAGRLARRPATAEWFVALYVAVVLSWAWPPVRFMAPLLPLLVLYGYDGVRAVGRAFRLQAGATRAVVGALAVVLVAQGAGVITRMTAAARETRAVPVPNAAQDDWGETAGMLEWLKAHTSPDAVLMGNLDPVLYLYTGRKSVRGFVQDPYRLHYAGGPGSLPLGSEQDLVAAMHWYGVSYLVYAPNAAFREGPYLARLTDGVVARYGGRLRCVYQSGGSRYRIYAVTPELSPCNLRVTPNLKPPPPLVASN
jgi:hypothetical protein